MNEEITYHVPVLLKESVDGMNIQPGGTYVDVTFGGGGHSKEILSRLGKNGTLLGFDQDEDAEKNIVDDKRFIFVRSNFRYLHNFLRYHNIDKVDSILADLGVSSHHFDDSERGFSFRFDGKLDMRMNQRATTDASRIINEADEERLGVIFRDYGEVKNWWNLARLIVSSRQTAPVTTIGQFLELIKPAVPAKIEKKYLAQVFQALRIEVNNEIAVLSDFLLSTTDLLNPGGRLVVISYHSLEDRLVKNFVKSGNLEGEREQDFYGNYQVPFDLITRKAVVPANEEIERNPRARSAKLRIAEKK